MSTTSWCIVTAFGIRSCPPVIEAKPDSLYQNEVAAKLLQFTFHIWQGRSTRCYGYDRSTWNKVSPSCTQLFNQYNCLVCSCPHSSAVGLTSKQGKILSFFCNTVKWGRNDSICLHMLIYLFSLNFHIKCNYKKKKELWEFITLWFPTIQGTSLKGAARSAFQFAKIFPSKRKSASCTTFTAAPCCFKLSCCMF